MSDDIPVSNESLSNALLQIADISKKEFARHAVADERYDQLHNTMTKLTKNVADLVTEVRVIAVSNEHIEKRILKEVEVVRVTQTKILTRVEDHDIQLKTLETNAAFAKGVDKGADQVKKFWLDIRFKTTAVVISVMGICATAYKLYTESGG